MKKIFSQLRNVLRLAHQTEIVKTVEEEYNALFRPQGWTLKASRWSCYTIVAIKKVCNGREVKVYVDRGRTVLGEFYLGITVKLKKYKRILSPEDINDCRVSGRSLKWLWMSNFSEDSCTQLRNKLREIVETNKIEKLIDLAEQLDQKT